MNFLARFLCTALLLAPSAATAARWEVVGREGPTEVVFHSKATMESFDGRTRAVEGWIELEPGALAEGVAWNVGVDLRELDTGIGLRNQHMRENHLHTEEFPKAVFHGSAEPGTLTGALAEGSKVTLELTGDFELHGVTRPRTIPVVIQLRPDGSLEASAAFEVSLEDHDIPLPRFLMLKLADVQRLEIRLLARPVAGGDS